MQTISKVFKVPTVVFLGSSSSSGISHYSLIASEPGCVGTEMVLWHIGVHSTHLQQVRCLLWLNRQWDTLQLLQAETEGEALLTVGRRLQKDGEDGNREIKKVSANGSTLLG